MEITTTTIEANEMMNREYPDVDKAAQDGILSNETSKAVSLLERVRPVGSFQDSFKASCKDRTARISTGIKALDRMLCGGLSNELYILGAETGTGKSAFLMHLAEKAADSGMDVLYFALEMGTNELAARSISSISYRHSINEPGVTPVRFSDILYWSYDSAADDFSKLSYDSYAGFADEYFRRYGERLHIIEAGTDGLTAKDIANISVLYRQQSGRQVVVFVDYLQIIRAEKSDRTQSDRKTKTDVAVTTLKSLASQYGMPVIAASSVGRSSYSGRITASAYKESGDVEYTGGVLLGWNWSGVTTAADEIERQEEIRCCKKRGYRTMTLEVLKFRNAERDTVVTLRYFPAYCYFEEDDTSSDGTEPLIGKRKVRRY